MAGRSATQRLDRQPVDIFNLHIMRLPYADAYNRYRNHGHGTRHETGLRAGMPVATTIHFGSRFRTRSAAGFPAHWIPRRSRRSAAGDEIGIIAGGAQRSVTACASAFISRPDGRVPWWRQTYGQTAHCPLFHGWTPHLARFPARHGISTKLATAAAVRRTWLAHCPASRPCRHRIRASAIRNSTCVSCCP